MTEKKESIEPKYGYLFISPPNSQSPGAERLEIYIHKTPTNHHFDPLKVRLRVASAQTISEPIVIHHPWQFETSFQVVAGVIEIMDRKGKKVEAFSFGGQLTIDSQDSTTTCVLNSPAPIFEIHTNNPVLLSFIEEVEILFAFG